MAVERWAFPEAAEVRPETQTGGAELNARLAVLRACVRAGDQRAARAMVDLLQPVVLRIVRTRRPRRTAEEDLTQEVFMKIFARLGQYKGDAPFTHWVSRIALTTCLDHGRAQKRRPEWRWADLEEGQLQWWERAGADEGAQRPGDLLATRELVEKLLGRLTLEDRRVIELYELEQRSLLEICAELGWNFEFAKMRLFRARGKLRRILRMTGGLDAALLGWTVSAGKERKSDAA